MKKNIIMVLSLILFLFVLLLVVPDKSDLTGRAIDYVLPDQESIFDIIQEDVPPVFIVDEIFDGKLSFKLKESSFLPADNAVIGLGIYRKVDGQMDASSLYFEYMTLREFMNAAIPVMKDPILFEWGGPIEGIMGGTLYLPEIKLDIYDTNDVDVLATTYTVDLSLFDLNVPVEVGEYYYGLNVTAPEMSEDHFKVIEGKFSVASKLDILNALEGVSNVNILDVVDSVVPPSFCENCGVFDGTLDFKFNKNTFLPADNIYIGLAIYTKTPDGQLDSLEYNLITIRDFMNNVEPYITPDNVGGAVMPLMGGILYLPVFDLYSFNDEEVKIDTIFSVDLDVFDIDLPIVGDYNYIISIVGSSGGGGLDLGMIFPIVNGIFSVRECECEIELDVVSAPSGAPEGGGGSGSGGSVGDIIGTCVPDWQISEWSECIDGVKTRSVSDAEMCDTEIGKPPETEICVILLGEGGPIMEVPGVKPEVEKKGLFANKFVLGGMILSLLLLVLLIVVLYEMKIKNKKFSQLFKK